MEVIRSIRQLDLLRDDWNALADRHRHPLLRHEWFACCAHALHDERDLRVAVVRSSGRLVAAAPLVVSRTRRPHRLVFIGSEALHEPCGLLFEDAESLRWLLDGLLALGQVLQLDRLEAAGGLLTQVGTRAFRRAFRITRQTAASLFVPVRGGWEGYHAGLSSRVTVNLRRVEARAGRLGPLKIECLSPVSGEVDAVVDSVMAVEASGWKARHGSAMAVKRPLGEFFRLYAREAAREGTLRVFVLRIGDRAAAVEMDVEAYDRLWQLKIGFDEAFAEYYPGLLLVKRSIRHAFDRGLEAFEFLGSAEPWERRWNPEARGYASALLYPAGAAGAWGLASDVAAGLGRQVVKGLDRLRRGQGREPAGRMGRSATASSSSPNDLSIGSRAAARAAAALRSPGKRT